jgi:MFS family permease
LPALHAPSRHDQVLGSGMVTRIHDELYSKLPHGRLVLVGGPGAGKTGAMILLLLAALGRRDGLAEYEERVRIPVPVWLTLGGWDPDSTALREWAAGRMRLDYPALRAPEYGPDAAAELLRTGRVALFLDGLDEIPQRVRSQALCRISEEATGLRLVLTSRPEEYLQAAEVSAPGNTAVIELLPVRPAEARKYLLREQTGTRREQWLEVADYIARNPDSAAAQALNNPLALSLAREAYVGGDPVEMTDPDIFSTPPALLGYLIDHVLVTAYPDERQRTQSAGWLAWIARRMGTSRDLSWWEIPGWLPRWQLRLGRILGFGFIIGLGAGLSLDITPTLTAWMGSSSALGVAAGVAEGIVIGLIFGIFFGPWISRRGKPHAFTVRWPGRHDLLRITIIITLLAIAIIEATFLTEIFIWLYVSIWIVAALGLAFEVHAIWATPAASAPSATPASTYRVDRLTSLMTGLVTGAAFACVSGFAGPTASTGLMSFLGYRLDAAVPFGWTIAIAAALFTGQVPNLKLTEAILACRHQNRVHFIRLLEDATRRQILRQAGVVYQFRHAALQDRLANNPAPFVRPPFTK